MLGELPLAEFREIGTRRTELRDALDRRKHEMIAIEFVSHHHIERSRRRSVFEKSVHVEVIVIGPVVR